METLRNYIASSLICEANIDPNDIESVADYVLSEMGVSIHGIISHEEAKEYLIDNNLIDTINYTVDISNANIVLPSKYKWPSLKAFGKYKFIGSKETIIHLNSTNIKSLEGMPDTARELNITYCNNLRDLDGCGSDIQYIRIKNCKNFESLKGCPRKLSNMSLYNLPKLKTLRYSPESCNDILCQFLGLERLDDVGKKVVSVTINNCRYLKSYDANGYTKVYIGDNSKIEQDRGEKDILNINRIKTQTDSSYVRMLIRQAEYNDEVRDRNGSYVAFTRYKIYSLQVLRKRKYENGEDVYKSFDDFARKYINTKELYNIMLEQDTIDGYNKISGIKDKVERSDVELFKTIFDR